MMIKKIDLYKIIIDKLLSKSEETVYLSLLLLNSLSPIDIPEIFNYYIEDISIVRVFFDIINKY